jgi:hypothetical protein
VRVDGLQRVLGGRGKEVLELGARLLDVAGGERAHRLDELDRRVEQLRGARVHDQRPALRVLPDDERAAHVPRHRAELAERLLVALTAELDERGGLDGMVRANRPVYVELARNQE